MITEMGWTRTFGSNQDNIEDDAKTDAFSSLSSFISDFSITRDECSKDFLIQEIEYLKSENESLKAENKLLKEKLGGDESPEYSLWTVTFSYDDPGMFNKRITNTVDVNAYDRKMARLFFENCVAMRTVFGPHMSSITSVTIEKVEKSNKIKLT